jgi:hypothetical protein
LQIEAYLAATVMIGGASEKAILLLIDSYGENIIKSNAKTQFLHKVAARELRKKFEIFKDSFNSCKNKPTKMTQNLHNFTVVIERVFEYCRMARNEVGHPHTIPDINQETVLLPLWHFKVYIHDIYDMIEHFKRHGVDL